MTLRGDVVFYTQFHMESFYFGNFEEVFLNTGLIITGLILAISLFYLLKRRKCSKEIPGYDEEWFGEGPMKLESDRSIRPFKIQVSDELLSDLQHRLKNTRFHQSLDSTNFEYGFHSKFLQEVVNHWRTRYDWKKEEEKLNQYPHFKTQIEGIDVHFVYVKSSAKKKSLPILLSHGWPGSFMEFLKVIPLLTSENQDHEFVFDVVCPSIPGYGFSGAPSKKGFNARSAARVFVTLMTRLGYSKFYVQGGDWGSVITTMMAKCYPEKVKGLHLNFFPLKWNLTNIVQCGKIYLFPFLVSPQEYSFLFPLKKRIAFFFQETGYFHINSTKPDTIASGLADSPVGLAAYILEKVSVWSDVRNVYLPDGGLTKTFSLDELITHVMIYWINNNIDSSMRFYKEYFLDQNANIYDSLPIRVPCGIAQFPNDMITPKALIPKREVKILLSFSHLPRGGHFAAWEEPQLFSDDIWKFVGLVEKRE